MNKTTTRDDIIKAAELLKAELAQAIACPCCATKFDRYAAVLKKLIALVPKDGEVVISQEIVNFLYGAGTLEGFHFGEIPPTERGHFWWRKCLPIHKATKDSKPTEET